MPDTLVLGGFTFQSFEIPESIPFGGDQMLQVHKLVGGARVIDAMGRDDRPIQWTGIIKSPDASSRARQLDAMRIAGAAVDLTWSDFSYSVVIKSFLPSYEASFHVPYSILVEVLTDNSSPAAPGQAATVTEQMASDAGSLTDQGGDYDTNYVDDGSTSALYGPVATAVSAAGDLAIASRDVLNGIAAPVASALAGVTTLIASTEAAIVPTAGGVVAGNAAATNAAALLAQVSATSKLPALLNMQSLLGRMGKNLGSVAASGATVLAGGGDLYSLAAKSFGTAAEWTALARVNSLTDPNLSGVTPVLVPPQSDDSDGLLGV